MMNLNEQGAVTILTESRKYHDPFFAGYVRGMRVGRLWRRIPKEKQTIIVQMFSLLEGATTQQRTVTERLIIAKCDNEVTEVVGEVSDCPQVEAAR